MDARAPVAPVCQLQIEELWHAGQYASKKDDPNAGALYKARLAYPKDDLGVFKARLMRAET